MADCPEPGFGHVYCGLVNITGGQSSMGTDRFVVDVVVMDVDHFVDRVFTFERNKSEPCNS